MCRSPGDGKTSSIRRPPGDSTSLALVAGVSKDGECAKSLVTNNMALGKWKP